MFDTIYSIQYHAQRNSSQSVLFAVIFRRWPRM